MNELAAAIFGALIGTALGAYLALRLPKSKPLILVDSVNLSTNYSSNSRDVTPNKELAIRIEEFPLDLGTLSLSASITEEQYVSFLARAKRKLDESVEHRWKPAIDSCIRLRSLAIVEDYDVLESIYRQEHSLLWYIFENAAIRGDLQFASPLEITGKAKYRDVVNDEDGDPIVQLPDARDLGFFWSQRKGSRREISKAFAERAAMAFAYRVRQDLIDVFEAARQYCERALQEARSLSGQVDRELQRYSRLVIEGMVANTGQLVFSLANKAKLVINLDGYPAVNPEGHSGGGKVEGDVEISLIVGASGEENINAELPLVLAAGGSRRFIGLSEQLLTEIAYEKEINRAYAVRKERPT